MTETLEQFDDIEYEFVNTLATHEQSWARKTPMDWLVPGKKYRGKTYREVMKTRDGRKYLKFWRDMKPVEFPDQTEEQKQSNADFRQKHITNIDECFKVYDHFLNLESRVRNLKRRVGCARTESSDMDAKRIEQVRLRQDEVPKESSNTQQDEKKSPTLPTPSPTLTDTSNILLNTTSLSSHPAPKRTCVPEEDVACSHSDEESKKKPRKRY
jgi:hypothetical protein